MAPLVRIKTIALVRGKRHHQRSIKIYWGEKTQLAQKLLFYYNGNEKTDALQHIYKHKIVIKLEKIQFITVRKMIKELKIVNTKTMYLSVKIMTNQM